MSGFSLAHNLVLPGGSGNDICGQGEVCWLSCVGTLWFSAGAGGNNTYPAKRNSRLGFPIHSLHLGRADPADVPPQGKPDCGTGGSRDCVHVASLGGSKKEISRHTQEAAPTKAHTHS